jgi:hypothetical protein
MAKKLNRIGGKTPARNSKIVRATAARKQIVETMSRYRSTGLPSYEAPKGLAISAGPFRTIDLFIGAASIRADGSR